MGIPERTVQGYENCDMPHATTHSHWGPTPPGTLTTPNCSVGQPQQQQQHHQYDRPLPPPPPPYPGHSKQVFSNMPGFRQSYSGSDTSTDMSLSSTENLASWPPRQDPQGEETSSSSSTTHSPPSSLPPHPHHPHPHHHHHLDNSSTSNNFSLLSRLQGGGVMSSVAESSSPTGSMERLSSPRGVYAASASPSSSLQCTALSSSSSFSSSAHSQSASATSTTSSSSLGGIDTDLSSSGGSGSGPLMRGNNQQQLTGVSTHHLHPHQHVLQASGSSSSLLDVPPPHSERYFPRSLTPTYHHPHPYVNVNDNWAVIGGGGGGGGGGMGSSPELHSCGPSQSPRVLTYVPFLPPPPEYPGTRKDGSPRPCQGGGPRGQGRCNLSDPAVRSSFEAGGGAQQQQSCWTQQQQPQQLSARDCGGVVYGGSPSGHGFLRSSYVSSDTIFSALTTKPGCPRVPGGSQSGADHMVNILNEENRRRQEELVHCYRKIAKLQKLEQEIHHVNEAYQSLVRSTDKRERLESAIKSKLQEEVQKLQSENEDMKAQLQKAGPTRKLRSRSEGRVTQKEKESAASLRQLLNDKHLQVQLLESHVEQWELRYSELQAVHSAGQSLQSFWCDSHSVVAENSQKMAQRLSEETQRDERQHAEQLSLSQCRISELEANVTRLQTQLTEKEETLKTHQHQHRNNIPHYPPTEEEGCPSNLHHHRDTSSCPPHHRLSSSLPASPSSPSTRGEAEEESFQSSRSHQDLSATSAASSSSQQNRVQLWQV